MSNMSDFERAAGDLARLAKSFQGILAIGPKLQEIGTFGALYDNYKDRTERARVECNKLEGELTSLQDRMRATQTSDEELRAKAKQDADAIVARAQEIAAHLEKEISEKVRKTEDAALEHVKRAYKEADSARAEAKALKDEIAALTIKRDEFKREFARIKEAF